MGGDGPTDLRADQRDIRPPRRPGDRVVDFRRHQVGGALAALGAGAVRDITGTYLLAFIASGLACLVASLLVLRISRGQLATAAAE